MSETDFLSYSQSTISKRKDENFPVASLLVPKEIRQNIVAFYNFARHADDIADEGDISQKDRLSILSEVDNAIANDNADIPQWAEGYMRLIRSGDLDNRNGRALLSAFSQDVSKLRYDSWEELLEYCMHSAAPVGRAVLELHQQWDADIRASDKLCNILQILNHLQDLKSDYVKRGRVYFPVDWFDDITDLRRNKSTQAMRNLIDKALDRIEIMLQETRHLPLTLKGRRVKSEISTIWHIANMLCKKLRKQDPIAKKVKLSKWQYSLAFIKGIRDGVFIYTDVVSAKELAGQSKSSFLAPLLCLSKEKQRAMFSLYAFCRVVDDAVDDAKNSQDAQEKILFWQGEVDKLYSDDIDDYPFSSVTRSLMPHVKKYQLDRQYFDGILAGMQMDIDGMVRPSAEKYDKYCYNVASCVGHLSVNIFGENNDKGRIVADNLGKSLQTINIMRDIYEDAQNGRIYMPKQLLRDAGIGEIQPQDISNDVNKYSQQLGQVLQKMGAMAKNHMDIAMSQIDDTNKMNLKPAISMAKIYNLYYNELIKPNYQVTRKKLKFFWLRKVFQLL